MHSPFLRWQKPHFIDLQKVLFVLLRCVAAKQDFKKQNVYTIVMKCNNAVKKMK